jgi:phosphatidylglycerophosphate synthase
MSSPYLNYFGDAEQETIERFGAWRTRWLRPLLALLTALKVTPDFLSLLALLAALGAGVALRLSPVTAAVLLALHVALDGVDGSLARYQHSASNRGALLDIVVDQAGVVVVCLATIGFQLLPPFWTAWYGLSYIAMIAFIVWLNALCGSVPLVIRSKYLFYVLFFLDRFLSLALTPAFLAFFALYNTAMVALLFRRVRCLI